MRVLAMTPVFLLPLACVPVSSDDDPGQTEPLEELAPELFTPVAGVWTVDSRAVLKDECGGILGDDQTDPNADADTLDIIVDADDAFTIVMTFDDGEAFDIACTTAENLFTCEGELDLYEINATVLTVTWAGGGELLGATQLSATLDATASCEGDLCDVAETYLETELPCDGTVSMEASLQEEAPE